MMARHDGRLIEMTNCRISVPLCLMKGKLGENENVIELLIICQPYQIILVLAEVSKLPDQERMSRYE